MFRKSNKVLNIFEKQSWLYGCRSIQSKKEIHSNRKFGSNCFCKITKPNKNFLKVKCDWLCLYFDTTDGYLLLRVSTCIESSQYFWETIATVRLYLTTNIFWLASCFSQIKKRNRHFSGNQSVTAGVSIVDTISYFYP